MRTKASYLIYAIKKGFGILRSNPALFRSRLLEQIYPLKLAVKSRIRAHGLPGPESVQVSIANGCNYRCLFCWDHPALTSKNSPYPDKIAKQYHEENPDVDTNNKLMDTGVYESLIDDLSAMGTSKIQFIGRGEPMLHKSLPHFIEYAKKRGMFTTVYTNGSLLTREKIEALTDAGLDSLNISFNAGRRETYAKIHTTVKEEMYDRIIANLCYLDEYRKNRRRCSPIPGLSFVLCNLNYNEMEDMVRVALKVNARSLYFTEISIYDAIESLAIDPAVQPEYDNNLRAAARLAEKHGIFTNIPGLFQARSDFARKGSMDFYRKYPCYMGMLFSIVLADGTVNPCCEGLRNLGNVSTTSFRQVWNSEAYRQFRQESLELPARKKIVKGCRCHQCGSVPNNLYFHNSPVFMLAPWLRQRLIRAYLKEKQ